MADCLYALVTELKRSRAPQLLQTLKGSCVMQIKEVFNDLDEAERPAVLARLVKLLLDHCPDTPHFELVVGNLVEDVMCMAKVDREGRFEALKVSSSHPSPLSDCVTYSLTHPLYEEFPCSK